MADPHLFHPEQVRTGERVARLDPPRPYWAGCALCGTSVDLAEPARLRLARTAGAARTANPAGRRPGGQVAAGS